MVRKPVVNRLVHMVAVVVEVEVEAVHMQQGMGLGRVLDMVVGAGVDILLDMVVVEDMVHMGVQHKVRKGEEVVGMHKQELGNERSLKKLQMVQHNSKDFHSYYNQLEDLLHQRLLCLLLLLLLVEEPRQLWLPLVVVPLRVVEVLLRVVEALLREVEALLREVAEHLQAGGKPLLKSLKAK